MDGRVLRFDSFSKVVCAGLRVGYVSGPSPLVRGITVHMQASCVCPPMLSQVSMNKMINVLALC